MEHYTPFMDYDADNQCIIVIDDGIPSFQSYMITNNEGCWRKEQKEKKSEWREEEKQKEAQLKYDNINNLTLQRPKNNQYTNQYNNQYYPHYGYGVTMTPHQHPQTPSPVSPQSPPTPTMQHHLYNNKYQPFQAQNNPKQAKKDVKYKPCTDLFEVNKKYHGLKFEDKSRSNSAADSIKRTVKQNGVNYEAYGIEIIGPESYEWNFILTDRSSMIFGLIDATKAEQNLLYILNTDDQRMTSKLFKHKKPDDITIKIMYNVPDKCMIVENTNFCGNCHPNDAGQRYIFAENIDINLKYRLCVLLDKPGEVTIFHDV